MKHSSQLAFILLILPSLCLAETGVHFLFPRDHISTSVPYFHVVGCSPDSQVIVELNGKVIASPAVQDSVFHIRISLPFGLNRIYVRPVGIGKEDTSMSAMLEILCGPRISQSYTKLYVPNEFHGNSPQAACLVCHAKEQLPLENSTGLAWCVSCHAETGQQFKKHVTNQEGDCNGCHRIADDLSRKVSGKYSDMNPCFSCHTDKIGQYAQDFIHGPVAGGTCTICHNPHGSVYEDNLRSPVPFLCMFCHTTTEEGHARVRHKPFDDGDCTACHDPHATNNRWVLVKSSGEVCLICHEGKLDFHQHRYEVEPRNRMETDLVLDEKGRLECLTCHNPHAGNTEHLLKTESDNPCGGCHPGHM